MSELLANQPTPYREPEDCCRFYLTNGTELLGEFEGATFESRPWLIRRPDGQVIVISHLLYTVAECLDGTDNARVAEAVSTRLGRSVSVDNIEHLVTTKLGPLGLITAHPQSPACRDADAASAGDRLEPASIAATQVPPARAAALLALRMRARLVPARSYRRLTLALRPLFATPVVITVLALLAALDAWLIGEHRSGLLGGAASVIAHPTYLLLLTAMTALNAGVP